MYIYRYSNPHLSRKPSITCRANNPIPNLSHNSGALLAPPYTRYYQRNHSASSSSSFQTENAKNPFTSAATITPRRFQQSIHFVWTICNSPNTRQIINRTPIRWNKMKNHNDAQNVHSSRRTKN